MLRTFLRLVYCGRMSKKALVSPSYPLLRAPTEKLFIEISFPLFYPFGVSADYPAVVDCRKAYQLSIVVIYKRSMATSPVPVVQVSDEKDEVEQEVESDETESKDVRSEFKNCIDETLSTVCRVASLKKKHLENKQGSQDSQQDESNK
ncbi:unnamed protein product [Caenorhabditis auriculariae]|uniref:Uncharacterized protein n=1 Tax=Caenorhabditis auriculariae TaxID=2777116 RepID=A0A8S1H5I1_9PELO|nr:unnamed protein product [Caenorhabditis auriculariae]